jgi:hypothetical protein
MLKYSNCALATAGSGQYVCLVRLIDARNKSNIQKTKHPRENQSKVRKTKVPSPFNQATIQMSRLDPNP